MLSLALLVPNDDISSLCVGVVLHPSEEEEGKRFALFAIEKMAGLCDDHAQFAFTVTKGYMVCTLVGIDATLIVRGVSAARCTCSSADLSTLVVHYEVLVLFLGAILLFFVYY